MTKHHFSGLREIITYCTEQKLPFALYSLPDEKQIHCIMQDSVIAPLEESSSLPSAEGFILYPFQFTKASPTYFIRADYKYSFLETDISREDALANYKFDTVEHGNIETDESTYCQKVALAVDAVKKGELKKVILSRVQKIETDISPIAAYVELFEMYRTAFVSLVYIPGKVLWLTATPELLISADKDEITTVALAGTKKTSKGNWTDKEQEEQQMVTDYINSVLQEECENVKVDGPHEVNAGNVSHLKTTFIAQIDSGLWDLVMNLHPTPAVCGLPKDKALEFITKTELHKRKYYAGFLGPCNIDKQTNLYVNLRCAELSNRRADLFIGGGITASSDPKAEWEETVLKTGTLLSVLKPKVTV
jgi:isochorismate synthase